ncbi:MAG: hypothetical protein CMN30_29195 [Sandaracinus sp.]|nr:hypothetical protein [Sandaracinus sp.]
MRIHRLLPLLLVSLLASTATAQRDGFDLTLVGTGWAVYGEPHHLTGTAYEVRGLAGLRELSGGMVKVELTERRNRQTLVVSEASARTGSDGSFALDLSVPERALSGPALRVTVGSGGAERVFHQGIALSSPLVFDALADRNSYEPGETAHLWFRLRRKRDGAPEGGRTVHVTVQDSQGATLHDSRLPTNGGGVAALAVALGDGAREGSYRVTARLDDSVAGAQSALSFQVARRTVERLFVDVDLDDPIVAPGARLRGTVHVKTPSGTPVAGATVTLSAPGIEEVQLRTGDDGRAAIRVLAPAYLAGDMEQRALGVRVSHPAHGALHTAAPFLLSRVRWRVTAAAEAGGLVPDVATEAYLSVTDARGEPPPAGTVLRVTGPGLRGEVRVATDAHGLAALPVTVSAGDFGPIAAPSPCAGREGISLDVSLETSPAAFTQTCVGVAPDAELLLRLAEPFAQPGAEVAFTLERRGSARGEVLVEALAGGRLVASARTRGARGTVTLPEAIGGVVELRARPITDAGAPAPFDAWGELAHGVGSSAALVVRPADAFALTLEPEKNPYLVRDEARVSARLSSPSPEAWIAYVARDLAAHGGEGPWRLDWLGRALDRALVAPGEGDAILVRASLAALVERDRDGSRARPLVTPPWGFPQHGERRNRPEVLRDVMARRAELMRREAAQAMVQLERQVAARLGDRSELEKLLVRRGAGWAFRDDALELAGIRRENLGGARLTVPMLRDADPAFSFDRVARRVARSQLVRLLVALRRLSDPDDPNAARVVAGQPPERWLSRLMEIGALPREALIDPWGNPFRFRPTSRPVLIFSAEAAGWELGSAGPDGRYGTGDDVRDPFERVVPEGSPYAVASGEDALMLRLSALAPGPRALVQMGQAYDAMSLAAAQERTRGPVSGSVSEGDMAFGGEEMAEAELSVDGVGGGGALGGLRARRSAAPAPSAQATREAPMDDAMAEDRSALDAEPAPPPEPLAAMASRIRERFPATLHFEAGRPLDGAGATLSFPLADALTTYRVEAIAWTASGWTTTASTEVRVDQRATVDAPVPPFAAVGDTLRLPLRVDNRSGEPLQVQLAIEGEGVVLAADAVAPIAVEARRGVEVVVPIRLSEVGEGHVVVRATTTGGEPLDAVRRPLKVWPDARSVRRTVRAVVEGDGEVALDLPADASARGPAEIRVVRGTDVFGPLDALGLEGAWALALTGQTPGGAQLEQARAMLRAGDPRPDLRLPYGPVDAARALGVVWGDGTTADGVVERALRAVAERIPTGDAGMPMAAEVLRLLAPAKGRPALASVLDELRTRLVEQLAGAVRSEDPAVLAPIAAALAITRDTEARAQARELLRRLRRAEVRFGDQSFVEAQNGRGTLEGRYRPSAAVALAHAALGDREEALRYVRQLLAGASPRGAVVAVAAAAAGLLGGDGAGRVDLQLDGQVVELSGEAPVRSASVPTPGPGEHTLRVTSEGVALVVVSLRYARPWDAAPQREARFAVSLDGELGARDVRAALALTVQSRQPRLVRSPVAYVDLPAGAELDQPTREALEAVGAAATMEGRTLRVALPALAPGRRVVLPLPLRWSVGGELHGLGVTVVDEGESAAAVRPASVLPSRTLSLPDAGAEPEAPEGERPAPPDPEPIPLLRRLGPVAILTTPSEVRA